MAQSVRVTNVSLLLYVCVYTYMRVCVGVCACVQYNLTIPGKPIVRVRYFGHT